MTKKYIIFLLSIFTGLANLQAQSNFEVMLQKNETLFYSLSDNNGVVQILAWDSINSPKNTNYLLNWNPINFQIDSINVDLDSSDLLQGFNLQIGDTTILLGLDNNQKDLFISQITSTNSILRLNRKINLDGFNYVIHGAFIGFNNQLIAYGVADTNYNQEGWKKFPFILKYNYKFNSYSNTYLFDRGIYSGSGIPYSLKQLSNSEFALSCDGCKKYQGIFVDPNNNGFADLAILDNNFNTLVDTTPLPEPYPGFPFYNPLPRFQGPQRIAGIQEMPNGDLVFLGVVRDTTQARFKDRDIAIARWDRNLNKVSQHLFGTIDATDYLFHYRHLITGYDGYLYAAVETNSLDSLLGLSTERQKILVAKFDQQLNLIWQETYDTGGHMQFHDMIPTLHGVYLTANQRDFNGPFEKATLLRIKNSSPPLSIDPINAQLTVDLYPNPASSSAYLQAGIPLIGYRILDLRGKLIVEQQTEANKRIEVNTTNLAPGIYLIEAKAADANKRIAIKRLMKY